MNEKITPIEAEVRRKALILAKHYNRRYFILGALCMLADAALITAVWNGILAKFVVGVNPLTGWAPVFLGASFIVLRNTIKPTPTKLNTMNEWIEKFKAIEKSAIHTMALEMLLMIGIEYLV